MRKRIFLSTVVVVILVAFVMVPLPLEAKEQNKHFRNHTRYRTITVDDNGPADYNDIQTAIISEPDGTRIHVRSGTYSGFVVEGRNDLTIEGEGRYGDVIVTGSVSVQTYRGTYALTIGVVDSTDIEIEDLTVQAGFTDPFGIAYFNSTGKVSDNDVGGNTGNSNPGNGIAAFGISSPGQVIIEENYIHDYGKIGILVNAWNAGISASVPGGIYAQIKGNTITGTDFSDYYRVQDGIQVTYGGSAIIAENDISDNFQTGGSYWTCDGILIMDAHEVETKYNKIYDNQMGITIQKYVNNAELENDHIRNNEWGIYTWNWEPSIIKVTNGRIKENEYGWRNWDTDGIAFMRCYIKENTVGISSSAYLIENPTANFSYCSIEENADIDVENYSATLVFHSTKYDTYVSDDDGVLIEDSIDRDRRKKGGRSNYRKKGGHVSH